MTIKLSQLTSMIRKKSVYVDPGAVNKRYAVFVFKKVLDTICATFGEIASKVSEHSAFKALAKKLSDARSWRSDHLEGMSGYKTDNKKSYFVLKIKEVSLLKDMIYAYKSKFNGGTLIMGDSVIQKSTAIATAVAKLTSSLRNKGGANVANEKADAFEKELSRAKMKRKIKEDAKFQKLLDESFADYDTHLEKKSKALVDDANSILKGGDKIPFDKVSFKISQGEDKSKEILEYMETKRDSIRGSDGEKYKDEEREKIVEKLSDWIDTAGVKILYGAKVYDRVQKYVGAGYKIISVLGTGGTATVVKFINKRGKERALKIFYEKENGYEEEVRAIRNMEAKLGISEKGSGKKSALKKYFNAPKIRKKDGELQMKLATGVLDSDTYLKRGEKDCNLDISFFARMARSVLKGLSKLHAAGDVHGDIKPDNIHIMKNGRFKIADVGTVGSPGDWTINTKMYTHPDCGEIRSRGIKLTAEQKQKNDVYALGCSMLDVLCGKRMGDYVASAKSCNVSGLAKHFIDDSMKNGGIKEVLGFIRKLCTDKLDDVPTASEALKDPFIAKAKKAKK